MRQIAENAVGQFELSNQFVCFHHMGPADRLRFRAYRIDTVNTPLVVPRPQVELLLRLRRNPGWDAR